MRNVFHVDSSEASDHRSKKLDTQFFMYKLAREDVLASVQHASNVEEHLRQTRKSSSTCGGKERTACKLLRSVQCFLPQYYRQVYVPDTEH